MAKKRRKIGKIIYLASIIIVVIVFGNLVSHRWTDVDENKYAHSIKILTFNTHRMGNFEKATHNQVVKYLQKQNADVICLQEVEVYKEAKYLTLPELKNALSKYPYTYFDFKVYNSRRQFGNVVFSKFPLFDKQTIRYDSRASISSQCDMLVGGDTLRLITNHLESYRFEKDDWHMDTVNWSNAKSTFVHIRKKMSVVQDIRQQQAKIVTKAVRKSPYPCIVLGDFNATPLSYTYARMKSGMKDCFLLTSRGKLGNTFVKHHLGVRIDYILCSKSLTPIDCCIEKIDCSDHYPVCATIAW